MLINSVNTETGRQVLREICWLTENPLGVTMCPKYVS